MLLLLNNIIHLCFIINYWMRIWNYKYRGKSTSLSSSGTVRAWFNLPRNASNALAGTSASIGIRLPNTGRQTQPSLSVPRSALVERDEVTAVYVWEASTGRTRLRQVRAGQPQAAGRISILAGLAPGDQVAVDASAALRTLQQSSPAGAAP